MRRYARWVLLLVGSGWRWLRQFRAYRSDLPGYMHRWIFEHPWGAVRLHHILSSDEGRELHDHPWDFVSILLTNGYREVLPRGINSGTKNRTQWWPRWSVVRHRAGDAHRLLLDAGPVWTLVATGPKIRMWGFWVDADVGESNLRRRRWVPFREWREQHPRKAWSRRDS